MEALDVNVVYENLVTGEWYQNHDTASFDNGQYKTVATRIVL